MIIRDLALVAWQSYGFGCFLAHGAKALVPGCRGCGSRVGLNVSVLCGVACAGVSFRVWSCAHTWRPSEDQPHLLRRPPDLTLPAMPGIPATRPVARDGHPRSLGRPRGHRNRHHDAPRDYPRQGWLRTQLRGPRAGCTIRRRTQGKRLEPSLPGAPLGMLQVLLLRLLRV